VPDLENVHIFCVFSVLLEGIHNIYTRELKVRKYTDYRKWNTQTIFQIKSKQKWLKSQLIKMERNNHSEVGSNVGPSLRVAAQRPHKNLFLKSGISCPIISYILFVDSQMKCAVWDEKCAILYFVDRASWRNSGQWPTWRTLS
jgi:hypothetical protein